VGAAEQGERDDNAIELGARYLEVKGVGGRKLAHRSRQGILRKKSRDEASLKVWSLREGGR